MAGKSGLLQESPPLTFQPLTVGPARTSEGKKSTEVLEPPLADRMASKLLTPRTTG